MAIINMEQIRINVAKDQSGKQQAAAKARANDVFEDAVIGMQVEFEDHPVTQELDGGNEADNISDTLGGNGSAPRNLFSYIGFDEGDKPTDEIRERLTPDHAAGPKLKYAGKVPDTKQAAYVFNIVAPKLESIYKATPTPWARGLSWAKSIESYIPGLGALAHFLPRTGKGRSGGGIQVEGVVALKSFKARPYLSEIFANFLTQVKSFSRGGFRRRFK